MKILLFCGLLAALAGFNVFSDRSTNTREDIIRQRLIMQTDSLLGVIHQLQAAAKKSEPEQQLKRLFLQTRLAYKKIEWATEYDLPLLTRSVNGPPVPEAELNGQVLKPEGFQVIENLLFPHYLFSKKQELSTRLARLEQNVVKYRDYYQSATLYNWKIFDAAKLEVFRIETLGITGFDDPVSRNSMAESAASLSGLQQVMGNYTASSNDYDLDRHFKSAIQYLEQHAQFNTFDRAAFITKYCNSLTIALTDFQEHTAIPVVKYNRLLNQDARTLFDKNAFNINAFTAGPESFVTSQRVELGEKLFFDPVLSGTRLRSCASCHQPEKAFTDGMIKNKDISGHSLIKRNTPTLINAALQPMLFYDLRVNSLEDQIIDVVQNKSEMHGNMKLSISELWKDPEYRKLFTAAYPKNNRTDIDTMEVMNALASYIRNLTALNSRFDAYMNGNKTALNNAEIRGFNLFMGKARCGTCHYMPLFNGALPPKYIRMDAEVIGVPKRKEGRAIDPDPGRYAIIQYDFNLHAFKTPTVRNAARTAPYMHNGVFNTLQEVIDFYNKGGGVGMGLKMANQTLSSGNLHLTKKERDELIAFIKSLDSR